jgi:hypothetical protein
MKIKNRKITDEFSDLPISRQRKYQLRQAKLGRCVLCGNKSMPDSAMCRKHLVDARERARRTTGA